MTNGEKFKEVFGREANINECPIYCHTTDGDKCPYFKETCSVGYWWNAEYKEPVIRDNGVKDELNRVKDELEPTTKNNTVDFNKINELADFAIKATGQRDSYSQGMCNGIEYLRATLTDTKPKYIYSNDEQKESRKGHWIESDYGNMITQHRWYCSECGGMHNDPETGEWREVFDFKYDYCPLCGADMREVKNGL